jgi:hypothetical protein
MPVWPPSSSWRLPRKRRNCWGLSTYRSMRTPVIWSGSAKLLGRRSRPGTWQSCWTPTSSWTTMTSLLTCLVIAYLVDARMERRGVASALDEVSSAVLEFGLEGFGHDPLGSEFVLIIESAAVEEEFRGHGAGCIMVDALLEALGKGRSCTAFCSRSRWIGTPSSRPCFGEGSASWNSTGGLSGSGSCEPAVARWCGMRCVERR